MDKEYDIFISYRHDSPTEKGRNIPTARSIKAEFEKEGLQVFIDQEDCTDWNFINTIIPAIHSCRNFIVMLTQNSLDNCKNVNDWVRREIMEAFISPCKIILISPDGEVPTLPKDLPAELSAIEGVEITNIGVKRKSLGTDIRYLVEKRLFLSSKDKNEEQCVKMHIDTDYDCHVLKFKKEVMLARKDEDNLLFLKKGKHKFEFVADGFDKVQSIETVEIKEEDLNSTDFIEVRLNEDVERERKEREKKERKERGEFEVGGVEFKMVKVEGGKFTMGAQNSDPKSPNYDEEAWNDESLVHEVELSDYYIGETQVTQALWKVVMGNNPSYFKGDDNRPVEQVSWKVITEKFIPALNNRPEVKSHPLVNLKGLKFRLPTEAEWEYAARGGNKNKGYKYSGSEKIDEVAWYMGNSGGETHPVKGKKANELGLYDMSGNVWEWCNDWYGSYSSGAQTNPKGPENGSYRVLRGGSWYFFAGGCRVSLRFKSSPGDRFNRVGFRLVLCPELSTNDAGLNV